MQLLGNLLGWALARQGHNLTILGATSGDTGSAAIHALRGKPNIRVVMLSPADRMSAFQRAQMYSVLDDNILNVAVRGTFDDCQDLVKKLNGDARFKAEQRLGAVNSINWARIVAQAVYYFWAYKQSVEKIGTPVSFSVPSGNFGNAYAGLVSKFMGLPVDKIIVATNENDVLHQAIATGVYAPRAVAEVTSSPSMDITRSSNFERLLFEACGRKKEIVEKMQASLSQKGCIQLQSDFPETFAKMKVFGLRSSTSTHADRLRLIRDMYRQERLLIDPHSADGLYGAMQHQDSENPVIVLETAQPAKFSETMREAVGFAVPPPKGMEKLMLLPQRVKTIDADADVLKSLIEKWR